MHKLIVLVVNRVYEIYDYYKCVKGNFKKRVLIAEDEIHKFLYKYSDTAFDNYAQKNINDINVIFPVVVKWVQLLITNDFDDDLYIVGRPGMESAFYLFDKNKWVVSIRENASLSNIYGDDSKYAHGKVFDPSPYENIIDELIGWNNICKTLSFTKPRFMCPSKCAIQIDIDGINNIKNRNYFYYRHHDGDKVMVVLLENGALFYDTHAVLIERIKLDCVEYKGTIFQGVLDSGIMYVSDCLCIKSAPLLSFKFQDRMSYAKSIISEIFKSAPIFKLIDYSHIKTFNNKELHKKIEFVENSPYKIGRSASYYLFKPESSDIILFYRNNNFYCTVNYYILKPIQEVHDDKLADGFSYACIRRGCSFEAQRVISAHKELSDMSTLKK